MGPKIDPCRTQNFSYNRSDNKLGVVFNSVFYTLIITEIGRLDHALVKTDNENLCSIITFMQNYQICLANSFNML